jgi:two-component system nitrate/nitrite response regulator NarL
VVRGNRITVVVADDHPVYREGLVRAIKDRPDLEFVAAASDGHEAVSLVIERCPNVAVLDVRMPGLDGPEALQALHARRSGTRVVFLSAHVNGELVHRAVSGGAAGFLSKEAGREEICDAIVRVAGGESLIDPRIESGFLTTIHALAVRDHDPAFSGREIQILELISRGSSTAQAAAALHLSPETIKSHLKALFTKLGVSTRSAAVAEAMRRGIVE